MGVFMWELGVVDNHQNFKKLLTINTLLNLPKNLMKLYVKNLDSSVILCYGHRLRIYFQKPTTKGLKRGLNS